MDLLKQLFLSETYSVATLVISVTVTVITALITKKKQNKISTICLTYLPFILGIFLYGIYSLIFLGIESVISNETITSGILCGSISTALSVMVKSGFNKKQLLSVKHSAVKGILQDYVEPEKIDNVTQKTVQTLSKKHEGTTDELFEIVSSALNANYEISSIYQIVLLIEETVNSLNAKK